MVSKAVRAFNDQALQNQEIKTPSCLLSRGATIDKLNTTVILAPTSGVLKDIFAGRFNLNPEDNFVYVLPPELMINGKGFNALEFPIYYGAYIKGNLSKEKPLEVVCTEEQKEYMLNFLQRTIMGPDWSNPEVYPLVTGERRDFFRNIAQHQAPKDADGNIIPLSAYVSFHTFDEHGKARIKIEQEKGASIRGNLVIEQLLNSEGEIGGYEVIHEDLLRGEDVSSSSLLVNYVIPEAPIFPISQNQISAIQEHRYNFSVTCFGNSTGFDPNGYNTSFIVWMGGKGVVIDPSTTMLKAIEKIGLTEDDIPFIALTHCHEDHDSGVLELIKKGKKINLIATDIVFEELKQKAQSLMTNVNWIELPVDSTTKIKFDNGETFEIGGFDNIHPIPTAGLFFKYRGHSLGHSGDTVWGINILDDYMQKGVITQKQAEEHANRWFDSYGKPKFDLVLFEAGGPPIHTSAEDISEFVSPKHKSKVLLYHAPDSKVKDSNLRKIDLYETVCIHKLDEEKYTAIKKANDLSTAIKHPYWRRIRNPERILDAGENQKFESGRMIISSEDSPLSEMCVILSGTVSIRDKSGKEISRRGPGAIIGDWSHLTGTRPSSDVFASSDVEVLVIDVRNLIETPSQFRKLRDDAQFLRIHTGTFSKVFEKFGFSLHDLTSTILELQEFTDRFELPPSATLFAKGEESEFIYMVENGSIELFEAKRHDEVTAIKIQSQIKSGHLANLNTESVHSISGRAGEQGAIVVAIQKSAFLSLLEKYPGLGDALRG